MWLGLPIVFFLSGANFPPISCQQITAQARRILAEANNRERSYELAKIQLDDARTKIAELNASIELRRLDVQRMEREWNTRVKPIVEEFTNNLPSEDLLIIATTAQLGVSLMGESSRTLQWPWPTLKALQDAWENSPSYDGARLPDYLEEKYEQIISTRNDLNELKDKRSRIQKEIPDLEKASFDRSRGVSNFPFEAYVALQSEFGPYAVERLVRRLRWESEFTDAYGHVNRWQSMFIGREVHRLDPQEVYRLEVALTIQRNLGIEMTEFELKKLLQIVPFRPSTELDNSDSTVLFGLARYGSAKDFAAFVGNDYGILNFGDELGFKAAHYAAAAGDIDKLNFIQNHAPDTLQSPRLIDIAIQTKNLELLKWLNQRGLSINKRHLETAVSTLFIKERKRFRYAVQDRLPYSAFGALNAPIGLMNWIIDQNDFSSAELQSIFDSMMTQFPPSENWTDQKEVQSLIEIFTRRGAKLDTHLLKAAKDLDYGKIQFYLDLGADPKARNSQGQTPYDIIKQQYKAYRGSFKWKGSETESRMKEALRATNPGIISRLRSLRKPKSNEAISPGDLDESSSRL